MRSNSRIRLQSLLGLLFLLATPALAQQATFHDALLNHLAGNWVLQGTIAGSITTHDVSAQWTLEHQYLMFHEVSRDKKLDGKPLYEAYVYIGLDEKTSEYRCVWLDTYGDVAQTSFGRAPRKGNEIAFVFKDNDSTFHATFTYKPETDSWTWIMDNDINGTLKPFARVALTRAK